MKKSHIMTYIVAMALMIASYIFYFTVYNNLPPTLYMHSYHLFGIFLIALPFLFEIIFKKELPISLIIGFYVFVYSAQIFGSAYHGYNLLPWFDTAVHGFSAFLVAMFVAYLFKPALDNLNIWYQLLFIIACGALVGVLWEIIEFCGDSWFGMNNQHFKDDSGILVGQEALKDTMVDLISDMIGVSVGAIAVVFMRKHKKEV